MERDTLAEAGGSDGQPEWNVREYRRADAVRASCQPERMVDDEPAGFVCYDDGAVFGPGQRHDPFKQQGDASCGPAPAHEGVRERLDARVEHLFGAGLLTSPPTRPGLDHGRSL